MAGRPSIYTEELATQICERLSIGDSLRRICRDDEMPALTTVIRWVIQTEPEHPFRAQYVRAREAQAEMMADDLNDIADDGSNDWYDKEVGEDGHSIRVVDHEHIQRSKLRVDTRKWIASRLLSKRFGDKMQHSGEGGGALKVVISGDDANLL